MKICIVVARYNENVEWTRQFKNVIIYNKGEPLNDGYNEICLDNVGREGHTYYHHICTNYNCLADYTIFLQAHPFDHSPNLVENLNKFINNPKLSSGFGFLSENVLDCNLSGCRYHKGIPLIKTFELL